MSYDDDNIQFGAFNYGKKHQKLLEKDVIMVYNLQKYEDKVWIYRRRCF